MITVPCGVDLQDGASRAHGNGEREDSHHRNGYSEALLSEDPPPTTKIRPNITKREQKLRGQQQFALTNSPGHPKTDKKGFFITTAEGRTVCFCWSKSSNEEGCRTPCPEGRTHVCMIYLHPRSKSSVPGKHLTTWSRAFLPTRNSKRSWHPSLCRCSVSLCHTHSQQIKTSASCVKGSTPARVERTRAAETATEVKKTPDLVSTTLFKKRIGFR